MKMQNFYCIYFLSFLKKSLKRCSKIQTYIKFKFQLHFFFSIMHLCPRCIYLYPKFIFIRIFLNNLISKFVSNRFKQYRFWWLVIFYHILKKNKNENSKSIGISFFPKWYSSLQKDIFFTPTKLTPRLYFQNLN